jgi:hypothetical protein
MTAKRAIKFSRNQSPFPEPQGHGKGLAVRPFGRKRTVFGKRRKKTKAIEESNPLPPPFLRENN